MTKKSSLKMLLIIFSLLISVLLLISCEQGDQETLGKEDNWESGQSDLPKQIGHLDDKQEALPLLDHYFEDYLEIIEKTGYDMPTSKWFLHDDEGEFGYGLPSGTMEVGAAYVIELFAHQENSVQVDRDLRIQLTTWEEDFKQSKLVMEDIIHVKKVTDKADIYANQLPKEENKVYVLSVEFLDEQGEVEDTMVSMVYVPTPEINANVTTDQKVYPSAHEQVTLILQNDGPTFLTTGESYTIEKKVNNDWRVVPLDIGFNDIGILINPGDNDKQTINIDQLSPGEYRLIKTIYADGLDQSASLATEFIVE